MTSTEPVSLEHARLRNLANRLGQQNRDDAEILWLATALNQIGYGLDANEALEVKRSKGHDDKKGKAHYQTQMAIHWIAGRMNPSDGESPPKKSVAIAEAAKAFQLEVENLTRECPNLTALKKMASFAWDSQRPRNIKT